MKTDIQQQVQGNEGATLTAGSLILPNVLTIREVAIFLRCSNAHVSNLMAGKVDGAPSLPFIPCGRRKLVRRESLLKWTEKTEVISR